MVVVFFVIGALIGAGFASGQEIYAFFYKYGVNGLFGLIICSILTGVIINKIFLLVFIIIISFNAFFTLNLITYSKPT